MNKQTDNRRKKYLVSHKFQFKYIAYIFLFLYIGAAIGGYTVYYTVWTTLGEKLANVYPQARLVSIFYKANMTLLLRILLVSPIFVFIGIRLSHRIAGPIYRIGKYIESLIAGDYSHGLTLRKKDELKVLAYELSQLRQKLNEDKEKRTKIINDFIASLKTQSASPEELNKIKTQLEEL